MPGVGRERTASNRWRHLCSVSKRQNLHERNQNFTLIKLRAPARSIYLLAFTKPSYNSVFFTKPSYNSVLEAATYSDLNGVTLPDACTMQ